MSLTSFGIGCFINKICIYHVFYANDVCLSALVPAIALQEL